MIKKTKNGFLKAVGLMLAVMMLAACVISGTLAKYTSTGTVTSGSLTLQVAKWDIKLNDTTPLTTGLSVNSLTWTIENTEEISDSVSVPANGTIAPGTWGYAPIVTITNKSEVDATVTVDFTGFTLTTAVPDGLVLTVIAKENDDTDPTPIEKDAEGIDSSGDLEPIENVEIGMDKSITLYVYFYWRFGEGEDDTDYAGQTGITLGGTLTITAEQAK